MLVLQDGRVFKLDLPIGGRAGKRLIARLGDNASSGIGRAAYRAPLTPDRAATWTLNACDKQTYATWSSTSPPSGLKARPTYAGHTSTLVSRVCPEAVRTLVQRRPNTVGQFGLSVWLT